MADDPIGFDIAGGVQELPWSKLAPGLGVNYTILQAGVGANMDPTISGSTARTVNVSAGRAYNHGVRVDYAGGSIQLDTIGSGSRWDAVVLRYDWTTNTGTLAKVNGTATKQIPAGIQTSPGVTDDLLICLARVTAGQTNTQEIVDLREWSAPPVFWPRDELPPASRYRYGQLLLAGLDGSNLYVRRGGVGTETWASLTDPDWTALNLASGAAALNSPPQYRKVGNRVELAGTIKRAAGGSLINSTTFGGVTTPDATTVGALPSGCRPKYDRYFNVSGYISSNEIYAKQVRVIVYAANGNLVLDADTINVPWISLDGISFDAKGGS